MTQPTLFDLPPAVPVAPACIPEPERKRLSAQCQKVLDRLKESPATNSQLCAIALNYRARISDCRAAGFNIRVKERDFATGLTMYELVP